MAFSNPIIGGNDTIVRNAMQSEGFSLDSEDNITGWRIERDGAAYFTGVSVGNASYTIDDNGDASFNDLTVNDSDITIGGRNLLADIIDPLPRGIFALNLLPDDTGTNPSGGVGGLTLFGKITLPEIDASRQYKVCGIARFNIAANTEYVLMRCYVAIDADATTSDTLLFEVQIPNTNTASRDVAIPFTHCFNNTTSPGQAMHFSFFFTGEDANSVNYQGTNYGRIWLEDAGVAVPYGTFDPGTPDTPPQQYTTTYDATWSASYSSSGSRVAVDGEPQRQGFYSSSQGNQRALIGFPYSTIQSDLSGATVTKCEVYLYYNHWYSFAGGTAVIGTHDNTTTANNGPSTYPSGDVNADRVRVSGWGRNVGKWVSLGTTIGAEFTSGVSRGIAVGPGPSNSTEYYGKFDGDNMTHEPQLRITYTK